MATILFYTSIRTRVRDQESLMVEFIRQGQKVYFLNQQSNPYLPDICKQAGVIYMTLDRFKIESTLLRSILYFVQLVRFVWENDIKVVYSHLEPANFIAVFAQFFVRAKVVIVRHHHDLAQLAGFSNDFSYKITYRLAKQIIVVSEATKKFMIKHEAVPAHKIYPIKLGYDFSHFGSVNLEKVYELKYRFQGQTILVTVGRLDIYKRPALSIELVKYLSDEGIKVHLFLLGCGEQFENLNAMVQKYGLEGQVEFLGFADDVLSYLKASDWLVHPSVSESSCVVVKEAGLVELPVIVCNEIGDFNEYIVHGVNSCMVSKDNFVKEAAEIIKQYSLVQKRQNLGKSLCEVIKKQFHISTTIEQYKIFNKI